MKLDLIDKKILYELDFNARMPISKLAKKLRISRQVVTYRIRNLEKQGIIESYYVIIDNAKLGSNYYRLFLKLQNLQKLNEIIFYCKRNPQVAFLGVLDGYWNIGIGIWIKDVTEFERFLKNFVYKFGNYILDKEISIGTEVRWFQQAYLLNKKDTKEIITGGKLTPVEIDSIDKKLLILLTKNARTSIIELSKELNMSERAIAYRIKQLERKKIIVAYRTKIDYKKLGYFNHKVFFNFKNLDEKSEKEFIFYLNQLPNCIYVTRVIGRADIECEILAKTREEFFTIMQKIIKKFGNIIKTYDSLVIYKELIVRSIPISWSHPNKLQ